MPQRDQSDLRSSSEASIATRPNLLVPPRTVISPPSPVDRPNNDDNDGGNDSMNVDIQYDSPEETEDDNVTSVTRSSSPYVADVLSTSPKEELSMAFGSPPLSVPTTPFGESGSRLPSPFYPLQRTPSPSSPNYRPRGKHHRRESSTHKVRETTYGEQRSTQDGERMVNQYKIGKSLGRGAYAKVELGLDVGTGTEYAIKEFSKSRLHHHALQEKQKSMREGRLRRGTPFPPDQDSKRNAGNSAMAIGDLKTPATGSMSKQEGEELPGKDDPLALIRREIAVMKKLDHPNLIHLYEAISVPDADSLFLVLEYLPGGVLMNVDTGKDPKDVSPPFPLERTREYFRQLSLGLEYLHANEVVHRDIKPDNILLTADREIVKLCDFGVSEMFVAAGDDRITRSNGSPAFMSPESFSTSSMTHVHGKAVDIWALGVTLYCMLTGALPFNVDNPIDIFAAVRDKEPEIPPQWDSNLHTLISGMLRKDPERRFTMCDIRNDPWVTENSSQPMISVEDNLYYVGKKVEEPTQEELGNAFSSLRGVFTVIRAVQKMRRLQLHRRSTSNNTPPSPGASAVSLTSGSMDSYVSQTTDSAALTGPSTPAGITERSQESPKLFDSPAATERADSDNHFDKLHNPFTGLRLIDTDVGSDNHDTLINKSPEPAGRSVDQTDSTVQVESPSNVESPVEVESPQTVESPILVESPI